MCDCAALRRCNRTKELKANQKTTNAKFQLLRCEYATHCESENIQSMSREGNEKKLKHARTINSMVIWLKYEYGFRLHIFFRFRAIGLFCFCAHTHTRRAISVTRPVASGSMMRNADI